MSKVLLTFLVLASLSSGNHISLQQSEAMLTASLCHARINMLQNAGLSPLPNDHCGR
jgi:hypothetical protein